MLLRSVGPPSHQCTQWWASHQPGGREQPGKVQPRSRRCNAISSLGGGQPDGAAQVQQLRLRTQDRGDNRGVARHPPHRLRRQEVPGQRRPGPRPLLQVGPSPSSPRPRPWPWSAPHRRRRRRGGRPRAARPRGAGRWCGCPTPVHRRGLRCGQRPQDRLQHGLPLGVQPQPVLGHPVIGVRLGQRPAVLEQVLPALELPRPPVLRDDPGSQRPDLGRPVGLGDRDEPRPAPSPRTPGSTAAAACPSRSTPPRRCATGTRASSTASASRALSGLATASATFTSAAAPPAR